MKARFNITLPEVQLGTEGTQIRTMAGGHVETEVEFTVAEMRDLYELQKEVMKEAPELVGQFISDVCREFVKAKAKCTEELIKDEEFKENYEHSQQQRRELKELRERLAKKRQEANEANE